MKVLCTMNFSVESASEIKDNLVIQNMSRIIYKKKIPNNDFLNLIILMKYLTKSWWQLKCLCIKPKTCKKLYKYFLLILSFTTLVWLEIFLKK